MRNESDDNRYGAHGVEAPHAEFRVNNGRVIACLVISAAMGIGSASLIAVGFLAAFLESVNERVAAIGMGACGLIVSLLLFASNWKKYGQRVVVLSEGFSFRKRGRWAFARWKDIDAVWRSSSTIQGSRALLETDLWVQVKDGTRMYLTSFFRDMERLVEIVLTETMRRMVPEMRAHLEDGQTVAFGKLKISATGLMAGGKELAWKDVAAIQVAYGGINIRPKRGRGS